MPEITNDLMDMIAADDSASQISDKIKDVLFAKSAGKVDAHRPNAANSLFGEPPTEADDEVNAAVAVAADEISGDAAAAREGGEEE
jgi:hypothetical protein|tara:strand:+ start:832 stop:1089 length:258 start_codon:yes stop_codon:yes gene_type:complete